VLLRVPDPVQTLEGGSGSGNITNPSDIANNPPNSVVAVTDTPPDYASTPSKYGLVTPTPGTVLEADIKDLLEDHPTLLNVAAMGDPSVDIHRSLSNQYHEDSFFKDMLTHPRNYKNFEVSNRLVFLQDNGRRVLCVPDVAIGKRRVRKILISYAHSILAHLGPLKIISYLRENIWWKGLNSDVEEFCRSCSVCQSTKPTNHAAYGLLETLQVPTYPWETIRIDFVGPLPESKTLLGTFDMIMVIIDHLTSMVHLVPMKQMYRCNAHIFPMLADTAFTLNDLYPLVSARNPFHACSIRC
jgi:hypothetical protein